MGARFWLVLPALLVCCATPATAITELDGKNVHNVGSVLLHVANFGLFGSFPGTNARFSGAPSGQWPPGSGIDHVFGGGPWVGALKNGEPHVTGIVQTSSSIAFEFRAGRSELDRTYRSRELATGGFRLPSHEADDDGDQLIDEDPLNGRDDDGDGAVDEDFAAISDQMFTCEFADDDPRIRLALPDHVPLEIFVRQSTYAWETEAARDCIGFEYEIRNRGRDPLDDVYVGFWADFNVGPRDSDTPGSDDRAGFWEGMRTVQLGGVEHEVRVETVFTYDADTDEGHSPGWVGLVFLGAQAPLDEGVNRPMHIHNFRMFVGTASFDQGGDPSNDEERYRVMAGTSPRSLPPPQLGSFRRPVEATQDGDYRVLVSAGPFTTLPPGESLSFRAALVLGRGREEFLDNAARIRLLHDGDWEDCDHDSTTGVSGRETAICGPGREGRFAYNPCHGDCPAFDRACGTGVPDEGCIWINHDCASEDETGVTTGVGGRECWIPWLASGPPPPPRMRVAAFEDRVEIYWDDTSETIADPLLGVVDFESYRIWRADGWTRPPGTNAATGPPKSLWGVLREFDVAGNGVASDTGFDALRYRPGVPDSVVSF